MKQSAETPAGGRRLLRFLPALAVMAVIFLLSSRTQNELDTVLPWLQELFPAISDFNWAHFVAYFVLALTFAYGLGARRDNWPGRVLVVLLCGLYGLTDEYHQSFVGGRTPDIHDIRNDCIGAALAMLLLMLPPLRKRWRKMAP